MAQQPQVQCWASLELSGFAAAGTWPCMIGLLGSSVKRPSCSRAAALHPLGKVNVSVERPQEAGATQGLLARLAWESCPTSSRLVGLRDLNVQDPVSAGGITQHTHPPPPPPHAQHCPQQTFPPFLLFVWPPSTPAGHAQGDEP